MPTWKQEGWDQPRGHANDGVDAIFRCLQDWFEAMQRGEAHLRVPALDYPKSWTPEELDRIVVDLDAEHAKELTHPTVVGNSKATQPPGFVRLEYPQRLALVQQLHSLVMEHKQALRAIYAEAYLGRPAILFGTPTPQETIYTAD